MLRLHILSNETKSARHFFKLPVRYMASIASSSSVPPAIFARGSGGRSSFSGVIATVFGSTGFLGRYVVNQLGRVGSQVIATWRGDELDARHLKPMGDLGQIIPFEIELRHHESLRKSMENSNVVINLLGKNYSTRYYSLYDVHVTASRTIAQIAKEVGVEHFIHISSIGADKNSQSEFLRTKALGEEAVRDAFPSATIIRPCDMFGDEDNLINRACIIAKTFPFIPLVKDGKSKLQPVWCNDIAMVIRRASQDPEMFLGKTFELGGTKVYTIREFYEWILAETKLPNNFQVLPHRVAEMILFFAEKRIPIFNPDPKYTRDHLIRETSDMIVTCKNGELTFADIDAVPHDFDSDIAKEVTKLYRRAGDASELYYR
ncbi:hypothetical protein GpartN1_g4451.t1 [Galdieria partita]|uniref:NAD-dependent epimerase/dehydratase domain-containing protein n=1 Tax=Galdieria partita TaxID=83374 RepID=A0A9C7PY95_9RHOD|nr:hypothetical protein GpartN1_g4451.t1 [Galdieria partita]